MPEEQSGPELVVAALQSYAAAQNDLGRLFARSRGMHTTDAAAVVEILSAEDRGLPLTPARLAERIALTSGATSILLNRLEEAGHIRRTRDQADRRIVTVRSTPTIHEDADAVFAPLRRRLEDVLSAYSPEDLGRVAEIVDALRDATRAHIDATEHLGSAPRSTAGPVPDGGAATDRAPTGST